MFKIIKENKIIGISEEYPVLLDEYEVVEDTEHTCEDYKHYDGEFTLHNIEKDNEEMKQARANAYAVEVDCLVAQYNRKKLFDLFEEGEEEALKKEIEDKVTEIKEKYPYVEE